jgi:hypothetical protein
VGRNKKATEDKTTVGRLRSTRSKRRVVWDEVARLARASQSQSDEAAAAAELSKRFDVWVAGAPQSKPRRSLATFIDELRAEAQTRGEREVRPEQRKRERDVAPAAPAATLAAPPT